MDNSQKLEAIVRPCLLVDVNQVGPDGADRDKELFPDLFVAQELEDEGQDLGLAPTEIISAQRFSSSSPCPILAQRRPIRKYNVGITTAIFPGRFTKNLHFGRCFSWLSSRK
jgi:hypothetical protein